MVFYATALELILLQQKKDAHKRFKHGGFVFLHRDPFAAGKSERNGQKIGVSGSTVIRCEELQANISRSYGLTLFRHPPLAGKFKYRSTPFYFHRLSEHAPPKTRLI